MQGIRDNRVRKARRADLSRKEAPDWSGHVVAIFISAIQPRVKIDVCRAVAGKWSGSCQLSLEKQTSVIDTRHRRAFRSLVSLSKLYLREKWWL